MTIPPERDGPELPAEVEITPAMLEAGAKIFTRWKDDWDASGFGPMCGDGLLMVRQVFQAMSASKGNRSRETA